MNLINQFLYVFEMLNRKLLALLLTGLFAVTNIIGFGCDVGGVHKLFGWFAYDCAQATEKVMRYDVLGKDSTIEMHLAKNEREGCQVVFRARFGTEDVKLDFGDFVNENGDVLSTSVFEVRYANVGGSEFIRGTWPDALVPFDGGEIELKEQSNQPFYIEVRSTENTPSGKYTAKVTLTSENSDENMALELTAVVWDFTLPDEPMMDTAMGLASATFWKLNNLPASGFGWQGSSGTMAGEAHEVYKQYYDFLLDHGVSAYVLPYDILDARADAYMSDPRVKSFSIPYPADDTLLQAYYNKVISNPVWAHKGYFYPIDEPHTSGHVKSYLAITERLGRLCPGYNMVTPFYALELKDDETGEVIRNFELQSGRSNILCPITSCYYDSKDFAKDMAQRTALGDRSWWYVCCGPSNKKGYCNLFVPQDGIRHRVLFWQQKKYDVTGLLYWDSVYWDKCGNPWNSIQTWDDPESSGDGSLLYPGRAIGIDAPIASLRLKILSGGMDDYTYLCMAEELMGEDWVNAKIAIITRNLLSYTDNDKLIEKIRVEIGEAIEEKAAG